MSSSAYILLLFICFFLHACNARRNLSSLDKKMEKNPHFSLKIVEKNVYDSTRKKLNEVDNKMKTELITDSKKLKHQRSTTNHKALIKGVRKVSIGVETKSWRVPHKKHGEKHPGFNLDYAPPKTHPPSHN